MVSDVRHVVPSLYRTEWPSGETERNDGEVVRWAGEGGGVPLFDDGVCGGGRGLRGLLSRRCPIFRRCGLGRFNVLEEGSSGQDAYVLAIEGVDNGEILMAGEFTSRFGWILQEHTNHVGPSCSRVSRCSP